MMDITVINTRLLDTIGFVKKIFGDKLTPVPIADEKVLNSVQENVTTLIDLRKCVEEYYKPLKAEARKPWDNYVAEEKKWLETIAEVREFADSMIKDFNNRKRIEIQAREQAEAEERAAKERARLEAEKKSAEAAGNVELVQQIEEVKQNTVAVVVEEKKLMNRGETSTMSEKEVIEDFIILNHEEFAAALLGSGKGNMIVLDKKTITAFEKYLLANKSVNAFPGVKFRRDYQPLHKTRRVI